MGKRHCRGSPRTTEKGVEATSFRDDLFLEDGQRAEIRHNPMRVRADARETARKTHGDQSRGATLVRRGSLSTPTERMKGGRKGGVENSRQRL